MFLKGNTMKVAYIITVPDGDFCWDYHNGSCYHFDNEGGHPSCDLGFDLLDDLKYGKNGVEKPTKCKNLEIVKD